MSTTQTVPILVYHHVVPDDDPDLTNPPRDRATGLIGLSEFRRHLAYLLEHDHQVISTTRLVDWLADGAPIPARPVVLHFDNGWLDTYTTVLPILRELGLTATCFVISDSTDAVSSGRTSSVRTATEGTVAKPFITWDHAKDLLDASWEIGAHTATHPRIGDLHAAKDDAGVVAEIERSNDSFARNLGFVPPHFAYPSGSRNERTDELLSRHYRSLRRWEFRTPPGWTLTTRHTSPLAVECQNIDNTVSFDHFLEIFAPPT